MNVRLLLMVLLCSSCLPDSFTKYKEDPPEGSSQVSSAGAASEQPSGEAGEPTVEETPLAAPEGLSLNQNVLLNVPSASSFKVGDEISSEGGALGLVTGIYRSALWNPTGTFRTTRIGGTSEDYDWIEVKLRSGRFQPFEDIDFIRTFENQRTYILGGGVKYFNTALAVTNDLSPGGVYNGFRAGATEIRGNVSSAQGRVRHAFIETGGTLNRQMVFISAESGQFSTLDNLTLTDTSGGTYSAVVDALKSNTVRATVGPPLGSNHLPGADITSDNGDNDANDLEDFVGIIRHVDGNDAYINLIKGHMTEAFGATFVYQNPWTSVGSFSVTNVVADNSFHGHVGESFSLVAQLFTHYSMAEQSRSGFFDTLSFLLQAQDLEGNWVSVDPPVGLEHTNGVISGTPTDPQERRLYRLAVGNSSGVATTEFYLEIQDSFEVIAEASAEIPATSYILHRVGQGHNRTPCRIVSDHLMTPSGDSNASRDSYDIACVLDVAEGELFEKGLKVSVNIGENLCHFVLHRPFFFNRYPATTTLNNASGSSSASTIIRNIGDTAHASCTGLYTTDFAANGKTEIPTTEPAVTTGGNASLPSPWNVANAINPYPWGSSLNIALKEAPDSVEDGNEAEFYCHGDLSKDSRYAGLGDGLLPSSSCDSGQVRVISRTWTFTEGSGCSHVTDVSSSHPCGGNVGACIDGAAKNIAEYTDDDLARQVWMITTVTEGRNNPKQEYDYGIPHQKEFLTNRYLANFPESSQCISPDGFNFDFDTYLQSTNRTARNGIGAHRQGSSLYGFICADSGDDIKARVRLLVRDWDRNFRASDAIDHMRPDSVLATRYVNAGSTREFSDSGYYNDHGDWDDVYIGASDLNRGPVTLMLRGSVQSWTSCGAPNGNNFVYRLPLNGL